MKLPPFHLLGKNFNEFKTDDWSDLLNFLGVDVSLLSEILLKIGPYLSSHGISSIEEVMSSKVHQRNLIKVAGLDDFIEV